MRHSMVPREVYDELTPEQADLLDALVSELARMDSTTNTFPNNTNTNSSSSSHTTGAVAGMGAEGALKRPLSRTTSPLFNDTPPVTVSVPAPAPNVWEPQSPRDRDLLSGPNTPTPTVSTDSDMQSLVQKAVDDALDKAQRQW
jgi:hypothetical protein